MCGGGGGGGVGGGVAPISDFIRLADMLSGVIYFSQRLLLQAILNTSYCTSPQTGLRSNISCFSKQ